MMNKKSIYSLGINLLLAITAIVLLFPTFLMLVLSLSKTGSDMNLLQVLLNGDFTLNNYFDALSSDSFGIYFLNSVFVASFVALANAFFCIIIGYAFSRRKFFGKQILFISVMAVLMIPQHVIMIPLYRLIVELGWLNTYTALIMPWVVTPFGIFLAKQYIDSLPLEIENAAKIDGAGDWYIIFKIIFPLSKPIIAVLTVYLFLTNWNSFLFPFLFVNEESMRTLPVGLAFYLGKQSVDWQHLMAGASISAVPVLLFFMLFQKTIIKSLTAGALK